MPHAETLQLTPPLFAFIPFFAALALVGVCTLQIIHAHKRGRKVAVGTYVFPAFMCGILIFLGVWCAMGLMDAPNPGWTLSTFSIALIGSLVPLRDVLRERLLALEHSERNKRRSRTLAGALYVIRSTAVLLFAAELSRLALEVPWNTQLAELNAFDVGVEFTVIALAMGALYFIGQRRSAPPMLIPIACAIMGLVQHFVIRFRLSALLPSDILAAGTAAEVSDQYMFTLTETDIWGIVCACAAILLLSMLMPWRPRLKSTVFLWSLAANIMLALVLALSCDWWIEIADYKYELGFDIDYWDSAKSYREQGFIPSFLVTYNDMTVQEPEGYSDRKAEELIDRYSRVAEETPERQQRRTESEAQFNELKPSIVVVMNETFADLSRLGLTSIYSGPEFFYSIPDAYARGEMAVSVFSGGTCNSEFEFLTNSTQAFTGLGKFPYELYNFDKADCLPQQFKTMGYQTTAIHPCAAENWNRKKVYREMGFDSFISLSEFPENSPEFHSGITDAGTYQQIINQLRSNKQPQFIFDVTIQNHSGYQQSNIPEDQLTDYRPQGFGDVDVAELNEYLSCIQASDKDLEWFVGELRKIERPVILVFFGDHHPSISELYNDTLFVDDPEIIHRERIYQTDYVIWANYKVAGATADSPTINASTDVLSSMTLDMAGAPLTDYQLAQIGMRKYFTAINAFGYRDAENVWYEPGTSPTLDPTYNDMAIMAYYQYKKNFTYGES